MTTAIRVLYVDDEPSLLDIGKLFLEEYGDFTVTTALSADEGIRLLEQEKFDAIISDYQMPGMDGIQFLVKVRSRFGPIPFILFTGKGREEVVIQAINSGADFYLQKGGEPGAQFAELSHKIKSAASRKKANDLLRKSEEKYRHVIEHSNEAIVVVQDGMLKLVNHKTIEITGYSEQELLSMQFSVFIHSDDRAMVVERHQKRMKGQEGPSRYAFRLSSKDGSSTRWVEISVVLIEWDGRPATLNFLTDITDRRRAEEELLESNAQLNGILASLNEAIFLVDPSTRLINMCNNATTRIFGYSHEELVGKETRFLHVDQEHFEQFGRDVITAYENPGYYAKEFKMRRKDGSVFPSEHFVRPICDSDGRIRYVVSVVRDITRRKRAEEKMLEAQTRTASVLEGIADTFYSLDDKWRFTTVNPAAEKAPFKRPASELLGKVIWDLYPGLVGTFIQQHYFDAAKNFSPEHYEAQSPLNGRWYEVFMQGRKGGVDVYMRDITERKLAEEALLESEKKFRGIFDTINDGLHIHEIGPGGRPGKFVEVNEVACKMLQYSREEMLEKGPLDLVTDYHSKPIDEIFKEIITAGHVLFETEHRRKDGVIIPVEINTHVVTLQGKRVIVAVVRDISERVQVKQELQNAQEELAGIIEFLPDATFVIDRKGTVIAWNHAIEEMTGIDKANMIGKGNHEYTIPFYGERRRQLLDLIDLDDKELEEKYQFVTRKGQTLYAEIFTPALFGGRGAYVWATGSPLFDKEGTRIGAIESIRNITERKLMEETLEEREKNYRGLFENAIVGIYQTSPDGTLLIANNTFARMFGYNGADEILAAHLNVGKDVYADPQDRRRVTASILEKGTVDLPKLAVLKMDKSRIWVSLTARVVRSDDGTVRYFEGTLIDITNRIRAEDALRTREGQLRRAEKIGMFGSWEIRLDDKSVVASEGARKLYDLEEPHLTLERILNFPLPEYRPVLDAALNDLIAGKAAYNVEFRIRRKSDGSLRDIHSFAEYNPEKKTVFGVIHDITKRKRAEETLYESVRYTRNLIEVSLDPLVTISPEGKITDVNAATERMTGYSRDYLIGTDFSNYFTDMEKAQKGYMKVFDDGVVRDYPLEIRHRDGKITPVMYNAIIYSDESGNAKGIFAAARDITERIRAEESLHQANKKLTLLSSITRHDINNQMTVLMGYLTLLKKKQPDPTFSEYFLKASLAAQRISSMIQFTREYECIGVKAPAWQDCRTLVDNAAKEAPLGPVVLKNDLPEGAELFADPLIVKVFYNLMDNAVRYGGKITTIRFSVEERDGNHRIVCEDDGDGVVAEEKEQIFERGFGKNTGLGLALAREILDITGITIRETGEPGKGARFEITVPMGNYRYDRNKPVQGCGGNE